MLHDPSGLVMGTATDMRGMAEALDRMKAGTFEVRASEVANPRPDEQLTLGGETFVVEGEPERRDPDRLVWTLDARPA